MGATSGAGILHWIVARNQTERRQVIAAIGPLWSWHGVWLVGTGGVMVMAFPGLMAASFSGCYLALFLILWCILLRGISIEVGGHLRDRLWQEFWDAVFVFSTDGLGSDCAGADTPIQSSFFWGVAACLRVVGTDSFLVYDLLVVCDFERTFGGVE